MTPDGKLTGWVIPVKEKISYGELLKHNSINCSSVLIRAEVAREFPMEHDDSHEDYILWLRVLKKYGYACAVNEPLLKYRLSNTGKSGNKFRSARMTYRVYRHMGFGLVKSCCLFVRYAFHGIKKYALSYLGVKDEA
jgi:teichuronic acid biosynthesis glycosyltransferase TuaG